MVWFQCEDCGENLKKPKLPNHFRMCSAWKLSCIDCGEMFSQETVQGHTQCITEAEKYGPKGEGKPSNGIQSKPEKPKKNADVDIHVGLSSRAPWFCSLCNAQATSRQTLMSHADGKKHRAKARAYHTTLTQTITAEEQAQIKDDNGETTNAEANDKTENGNMANKKRKHDAPADEDARKEEGHVEVIKNGEVIQADPAAEKTPKKKIKWKKLVTSVLKSNSDGELKLKKLQKLVIEALKESGVSEDEAKLQEKLLAKVTSSSRFVVDSKRIRLAAKEASS